MTRLHTGSSSAIRRLHSMLPNPTSSLSHRPLAIARPPSARPPKVADFDEALVRLATMSPADVGAAWRRLRKEPPPPLAADLLRRGLGWHLQVERHGGLSREAARELARAASGSVPMLPARASTALRPGTRLVRSWHGTTYAVLVTDDGFEFDGRAFTSLTTIAREITGVAWSGPRFFGLTASPAKTRTSATKVPADA